MNTVNAQELDLKKLRAIEQKLDDVMELIDTTEIKEKLIKVEYDFKNESSDINKARIGIVYHEVALNLSFLSETEYKGYAKKSFDHLSELFNSESTPKELMPFVASYRASALSLIVAETKKLSLLGKSFDLFEEAVKKYSDITYLPEFLRGSVAENLPWFFFSKRKFSKKDFSSIIKKAEQNSEYANSKVLSFTYWAWANQYQGKKYRQKALRYLDKAIELDPEYKAGRTKAEELKSKLRK
ncbi:hypothetical protein FEE95_19125 [Maribacter algarum]|uniref:Uncharacterized protein n=2 Tax=Maribacter algarum (ex Zhang et al. 2020) TaxID=2578118 RepID=A0A5S3PH80_9FLAO|nr:hypothetical protein FEE95_19125 [Maribacter algarum]